MSLSLSPASTSSSLFLSRRCQMAALWPLQFLNAIIDNRRRIIHRHIINPQFDICTKMRKNVMWSRCTCVWDCVRVLSWPQAVVSHCYRECLYKTLNKLCIHRSVLCVAIRRLLRCFCCWVGFSFNIKYMNSVISGPLIKKILKSIVLRWCYEAVWDHGRYFHPPAGPNLI